MKGLDFEKIKARLDAIPEGFADRVAKVGWFPDAVYPGTNTPVAYVAAIQEMGSPGNGIPPRPFIRPTIAEKKADWVKLIASGVSAVVKQKASAEDVLNGVGLQAASDIGATLASGSFDALSPITLMLRKMREENPGLVVTRRTVGEAAARVVKGEAGSSNNQPLHDTGRMIATLTHVVGDAE